MKYLCIPFIHPYSIIYRETQAHAHQKSSVTAGNFPRNPLKYLTSGLISPIKIIKMREKSNTNSPNKITATSISIYLHTHHSAGDMQFSVWLMLVILWVAQTVEGCPDICKCSRKSSPEKSEVNCHKRGLHIFPSNLPPDAWVLHLGRFLAVN